MPAPLPVAITDFARLAPSVRQPEGYAYIDKTRLMAELAREPAQLFLVRPRRFGKTLLVSALAELFRGHRDAFRGTWLHDTAHWPWGQETYPVLRMSLGLRIRHSPEHLQQELCEYLWDLAGESTASTIFAGCYRVVAGERIFRRSPATLLRKYLGYLHQQHGGATDKGTVVVLIDEYDAPINNSLDQSQSAVTAIVEVMRDFYGALKEFPHQLRFTFVTGVARFARTGLFSGANHLEDISNLHRYSTLLGVPHHELVHGRWQPHVEQAAHHLQTPPDTLREALARHYNGYRFTPDSMPVYNPWSLVLFLHHMQQADEATAWRPRLQRDYWPNYWAESGHTDLLQRMLPRAPIAADGNALSPRAVQDPAWHIDDIVRVSLDVQEPDFTALLYQAGYLTHTTRPDADGHPEPCLDFPNREIAETFRGPLQRWLRRQLPSPTTLGDWPTVATAADTWRQAWASRDPQRLYHACNQFLQAIPYPLYPHRDQVTILDQEYFYQALLYSWLAVLGLHPLTEVVTQHGRADLVAASPEHIWILELKVRGTALDALRQILCRGYPQRYAHDGRPVTVIGLVLATRHRRVAACALWDLGRFDPARGGWQREPFSRPLAETTLAAREPVPDWPFRQTPPQAPAPT